MKRPALQNKQILILRMAFRARKVIGTFEKRAPEQIFALVFKSRYLHKGEVSRGCKGFWQNLCYDPFVCSQTTC